MSRQASPAVIGGFVVGAIVLAVAGVVIFGSGRFFSETLPYVMYFEGDLKGLRVGASVDFQGVQIGSVTDIRAYIDRENQQIRIPVQVEFFPDRVETVGQRRDEPEEAINLLVERGLRAQLQLESVVTGQLFVQLSFRSYVPPKRVTTDPLTQLPEIPTVPTTLQQVEQTIRGVFEKLNQLPLEQMIADLQKTLHGIERLVNAPEVMEAVRSVNATMTDVQRLVRDLNEQISPIASGVTVALSDFRKFTRNADTQVAALSSTIRETFHAAQGALTQAQASLDGMNRLTGPNSPVRYELMKVLQELSNAARALRTLADYLEQYPSAVIFGRNKDEQ